MPDFVLRMLKTCLIKTFLNTALKQYTADLPLIFIQLSPMLKLSTAFHDIFAKTIANTKQ